MHNIAAVCATMYVCTKHMCMHVCPVCVHVCVYTYVIKSQNNVLPSNLTTIFETADMFSCSYIKKHTKKPQNPEFTVNIAVSLHVPHLQLYMKLLN